MEIYFEVEGAIFEFKLVPPTVSPSRRINMLLKTGAMQQYNLLGPRQRNWPLCTVIIFVHRTYPKVREVN